MSLKVNPLAALPSNVLRQIIHETGELTNVSKVSHRLRDEAAEEAGLILDSLMEEHPPYLIGLALQNLGVPCDASSASAIDLFFREAKKFCSAQKVDFLTKMDPYHPEIFTEYLDSFLKAQDMDHFCRAAMAQAPALKQLLQLQEPGFHEDYFKRCEEMKSLFKTHAELFTGISSLVIKNGGLHYILEEIAVFTNLISLNLSGNQISYLPPVFFQLIQLKTLNLNQNSLSELSAEIKKLKNLNFLFLDDNQLGKLPSQIGQLGKLQHLQINNNLLSDLPSTIGNLPLLAFLSASGNCLKELPESIGDLVFLKYLHLSGNKINQLPQKIGQLKSLEVLSLANNHIVSLPSEMGQLTKLKILMLSQNKLLHLPSFLKKMPSLEELHAGDNRLAHSYQFPNLSHCHAKESTEMSGTAKNNFQVSQPLFGSIYNSLGDKKWMEFVDGTFHMHGRNVFDSGLHGGPVEPGFAASMEKAFEFLQMNLHSELNASLYLNLHKITCAHFNGKSMLMGKEKIGKFRGRAYKIAAPFNAKNGYAMSQEAIDEFNALNRRISLCFGPSFALGTIVKKSDMEHQIIYHPMSREQVEILFNFFAGEFRFEIKNAKDKWGVLVAIARLIQRLEWLHPVPDGCGRTDTALMNFLLTKYGLTPVLLDYPYHSSCRGLAEWVKCLTEGMSRWRIEAYNASFG